MRDVIIIISIIAIILAGEVWTNRYLNASSKEIVEMLEDLKQDVEVASENQNKKNTEEKMQKIEEKWDRTSKVWCTLIVHQEIDNMEQAIVKAKSHIKNEEREDALEQIETAIFFADHIREREEVSWKNIF